MKRILLFISLFSLLMVHSSIAQLPKNRTTSTVIADALSLLPASNAKQYNQTMAELASTGEEGLLQLIGMLNPPEVGNNASVEFALSGWTHFSATDSQLREMTAKAYIRALYIVKNKVHKAFIIQQLELIGEEESIPALTALLKDEYLVDPAAQALVAMDIPASKRALLDGLRQASPATELSLINAVGQTFNRDAEPILVEKLNTSTSEESDKVILTALSKCGTGYALKAVEAKVAGKNYMYEKSTALDAYINLIERVAEQGNYRDAERSAKKLLSRASKNNNQGARVAALNILMQIPSANQSTLVKKALKDKDKAYVSHALSLYTSPDDKTTNAIVKNLSRRNVAVQEAVLYWLGNTQQEKHLPLVLAYFNSDNQDLRTAAIRSASNIGGIEAVKAMLELLKQEDSQTVKLAESALLSSKAAVTSGVFSVYDHASETGKIAALNILSNKKATQYANFVFNEMEKGSQKVQLKSAQTLKNVATEKNLNQLFDLMEQPNQKYTAHVQDAINQVLSELPTDKQLTIINKRMDATSLKHVYYPLLIKTGSKTSFDMVANIYNQSSGVEKEAAFKALTTSTDFETVYLLLEILESNPPANITQEALNAILKLITNSDKTGEVKTIFLRAIMPFAHDVQQQKNIIRQIGRARTFQGMHYVASYLDKQELKEAACQAIINIVLDKPEFAGTTTTQILQKVMKEVDNPDAGYQRDAIQKYLNENQTAGGFVALFDGQSLNGWKGLVGNPVKRAKMTPGELKSAQEKADKEAAENWIPTNGELIFTGKGDNLCTVKEYGDFEMYVDWKLFPGAEPDGGIYLRGAPQVQIWDTARVKVGAQVGSGGLYNNKIHQSIPLKVADNKLGTWNTFYIRMLGERVTVYLNGELVTDNVIMENYWDRSQPIFPIEQIELQAHGSKMAYRDIYIREIPRPEPFRLSQEEEKAGYEILFDGTNMHKWTGNTTDYVTEEGNIVLYPSSRFGGNLFTKEEFDNFIFRFEFQLTPGANNGLGIRTPMEGDPAYVGMELQILDNDAPIYSKLKDWQYHGSVYGIIPAKRGYLKPLGEWNYQEVIADGDNIKITLNGTVILEGNLREATKNGTLDNKDHPGLFNKTGHIGFLGHGSKVKFRNIRVKRL
jgi:HEAT repeat protein